MSAEVIFFPRRARCARRIELFAFPDGSGWCALVEPEPMGSGLSRTFDTHGEAAAYAAGLSASSGWPVAEWSPERGARA